MTKLMKALVWFVVFATAAPVFATDIVGTAKNPGGQPIRNATITFSLSQAGIVAGDFSVVPTPAPCYTSTDGSVVGFPNPLVAPVTNMSAGGSLSGTYYVRITYFDDVNDIETLVSPQATILATGSNKILNITAPVLKPVGVDSYRVYMGTNTASLKLQATTLINANTAISTFNASGAVPPTENASVCSIVGNDSIIPSYTAYRTTITLSNSTTAPGFPQNWYISGDEVDISNEYPLANVANATKFPMPILANPPGHSLQSISGDLTLNEYLMTAYRYRITGGTGNTCLGLDEDLYVVFFSPPCGSSGIVPGATTQVIFNNAGILDGDPSFTINPSTLLVTVNSLNISSLAGGGSQCLLVDNSGNVSTVSCSDTIAEPTNQIVYGTGTGVDSSGDFKFDDATNTIALNGTTNGTVSIKTQASAGTWTWIFPNGAGSTGQVLTSHGLAGTAWNTPDCQLSSANSTQVLYNLVGACSSEAAFNYDAGTNLLTVPSIKLPGSSSGAVTMAASASGATWNFVFPNSDGTSGQFLQTDGSGNTTWASAAGGDGCLDGSSDTQVLFNDMETCAGNAAFVFNKVTGRVKMSSGFITFDIPDPFTPTSQNLITTQTGTHRFLFLGDSADTTCLGWKACDVALDDSYQNTCIGAHSCNKDGTSTNNNNNVTAIGVDSCHEANGIQSSTCLGHTSGYQIGYDGTKGDYQTLVGYASAYYNGKGEKNTVMGAGAMYGPATPTTNTASSNVVIGYNTGAVVSTGSNNILVGTQAAETLTTGSGNIIICYDCDTTLATTSNQLKFGSLVTGNMTGSVSTATFQVNGSLVLPGSTSGTVTLKAPATVTSWVGTLPDTDGTPNQVLQTDGSGVLSWVSLASGCDISGTSTTQIIFNDAGSCAGDTALTWDKTNNTAVVGLTSSTFARIDDNKIDTYFRRTPSNETDYAFDMQVEVPSGTSAGTNAKGLRIEVYNAATSSPTDLTGAYIHAYEDHATSGNSSVFGLLIDSEASGSKAGLIDEQWGARIRMLNTYRECDSGDNCNVIGLKMENHLSWTDFPWQVVKTIDLENNNIIANSGLGEYDAIYIGNMGVDSGSVTEQNGLLIDTLKGAGTATNLYAIHVKDQSISGATTAYGLKIDNQGSSAGTTYAMHVGTGTSHFSDKVEFASKSPDALIAVKTSADFNSTSDQTLVPVCSGAYVIRRVLVANASTSLTTAAGGFYTGSSKGGTVLVNAAQIYTALTGSTKYLDVTLESVVGTDTFTANPIYLSLTTAQGGAATGDVYVYGECL